MEKKYAWLYDTPIGKIGISGNLSAITNIYFNPNKISAEYKETELIKDTHRQLSEYFDRKRKTFEIPISLKATPFQEQVWNALQEIPYGKTCSYYDIAEKLGNKKACRAVGMANNRNPIPILIPCHRVIGKNGKLVGYAGGEKVKQFLLNLEAPLLF